MKTGRAQSGLPRENVWRRWRNRSPAERMLLLEALAALAIGRAAIRLFLFQRVAARVGLAPETNPGANGVRENCAVLLTPEQSELAARIGCAVRTAAARIPGQATCLVQALAGAAMLRRRGIPYVVSLGVLKNGNGISAHAWLRSGDVILTGAGGHDRYATISTFVARPAAAG